MSALEIASQFNPWWISPAARLPFPAARRRAVQQRLLAHLRDEPRRAAVLRGPRQVGKTVMLGQCADDLLSAGLPGGNLTYFDFSDERLLSQRASPRQIAEHRPPGFDPVHPHVLLLDEVTRAHGWAEWLKQAVDRGGYRVLATDSTASLLREGSTESGVGRWDEILVEGLTYREFLLLQTREDEDEMAVERRLPGAFERYLARGGFPEHIANDSTVQVWARIRDDIASKAIRKDLAAAGIDTQRVNHLFQYLVENSGAILDVRKLAANLTSSGSSADPRSVAKWVDLLEQTMLIVPLPRRAGSPTARLKARTLPRLYAADHGLSMAFAPLSNPSADPEARGRAFEALVFRHLRDVASNQRMTITFQRAEGSKQVDDDGEIDFVVERPDGRIVAIEVTHSAQPRSGKVDALARRAERAEAERVLLVHGGLSSERVGSVQLVPVRELALETEGWLGE